MRTDPPGSSGQRSSTRAWEVAWRGSSASAKASHVLVFIITPPSWKSARGDARGPPQQLDLLARRRDKQPAQVRVRGIARQRGAGLRDRGVDDRQIPLEQRDGLGPQAVPDRKSTRLNSSHGYISYAVFCLKKKKKKKHTRAETYNTSVGYNSAREA